MTRPAPIIAGILAALLLLFGAYMGSYYALLSGIDYEADPQTAVVWPVPIYRVNGDAVGDFLWPAHQVDRMIRPADWEAGPIPY